MADHVIEQTTIPASPEVIRAVLLDFPAYPEWATDLKAIEILGTDDQGRATQVRFRAAGMGRSTSYVLAYDYSDPARVAWALVEGDLVSKLDGHYELVASAEGTDVGYELTVELVVPIPAFVKRRTQHRIMHAALTDLTARVTSAAP